MNDASYVTGSDGVAVLNLIFHQVFIEGDKIIINHQEKSDCIEFNKSGVLKIAKFIKKDYPCSKIITLGNIKCEIDSNWLRIKNDNNHLDMRPEMFEKIVKYIKERDGIFSEGE